MPELQCGRRDVAAEPGGLAEDQKARGGTNTRDFCAGATSFAECTGSPTPRSPGSLVRSLDDLLASAEAVEHRTAGKAALPEAVVDAPAEVRAQVRARPPGGLVPTNRVHDPT